MSDADAVIGGGQGYYVVNCKVNGATVSFDNKVVGVITRGTLTVPADTTGTPPRTYTVSMTGYLPYTSALTRVPAPGESINRYASLNPEPTASSTSTLTKSPLPVIGVGFEYCRCHCYQEGTFLVPAYSFFK